MLHVIALGWLYPRTAGEKTTHWGWGGYIFLHVLGVVGAVLSTAMLVNLIDNGDPFEWLDAFEELSRAFAIAPMKVGGGLLLVVLGIEAAFFCAALVFAPWGARDEPAGDSIRWSLKRLWLSSIYAVFAIVPVNLIPHGIIVPVASYLLWPPPFPYPDSTSNYPDLTPEEVQANLDYAFRAQLLQPVRDPEPAIIILTMIAIGWFFWAALRTIGAGRPFHALEHEPQCESCGYNLTSMPGDALCPECGTLVADSLPADHRTGPQWAQPVSSLFGLLSTWFTTGSRAVLRPKEFAHRLVTREPCPAYRPFLLGTLLLIGFIAMTTFVGLGIIEMSGNSNFRDLPFIVMFAAPLLALLAMLANLVQVLSIASIVGLYLSVRTRKNYMHTAMQMASYTGAFLIPWALIFVAFATLSYVLDSTHQLEYLAQQTETSRDFWMTLINVPPNMICFAIYLSLVYRGTAHARYANR